MHYSQITERALKKAILSAQHHCGSFFFFKEPKKDPECHQLNTIEGEFSEATHSKKEKKLEKNPKNISTAQHQYTHPL